MKIYNNSNPGGVSVGKARPHLYGPYNKLVSDKDLIPKLYSGFKKNAKV